jgi:hypothetical protein
LNTERRKQEGTVTGEMKMFRIVIGDSTTKGTIVIGDNITKGKIVIGDNIKK